GRSRRQSGLGKLMLKRVDAPWRLTRDAERRERLDSQRARHHRIDCAGCGAFDENDPTRHLIVRAAFLLGAAALARREIRAAGGNAGDQRWRKGAFDDLFADMTQQGRIAVGIAVEPKRADDPAGPYALRNQDFAKRPGLVAEMLDRAQRPRRRVVEPVVIG